MRDNFYAAENGQSPCR